MADRRTYARIDKDGLFDPRIVAANIIARGVGVAATELGIFIVIASVIMSYCGGGA